MEAELLPRLTPAGAGRTAVPLPSAPSTPADADRKLTHVEGTGTGFISWLSAYEEVYRPLPEIWFTDADGTLDTEALARYRDTGEVYRATQP